MLIDDDPDDVDIIQEVFGKIDPGIHCISFLYPDEAMRYLTQELVIPPDYIIVDLNMPRKNGLECLLELRAVPALQSMPVIMYSTTVHEEVRLQLLEAGATHVFQKPVRLAEWENIIRNILEHKWTF